MQASACDYVWLINFANRDLHTHTWTLYFCIQFNCVHGIPTNPTVCCGCDDVFFHMIFITFYISIAPRIVRNLYKRSPSLQLFYLLFLARIFSFRRNKRNHIICSRRSMCHRVGRHVVCTSMHAVNLYFWACISCHR